MRPQPKLGAGTAGSTATRLVRLLTLVLAAALAILVGLDGSPLWRLLRVLVVVAGSAAVLWYQRGAGRRGLGWTAVLLGVLGTVAGAGIGPPHLARDGMSVEAVAGLAALVAGLSLLGTGAVVLVRAARGWWRLLALPIALLIGQFLLIPLPMAVYATNVPPIPLSTTAKDRGLRYEDVTLHTADGVPLAAWYLPAGNRAAVVLLHGAGSTRSNVLDHAAVLSGAGYGVLLVDTRGHGGSGGDAMDWGWYGELDIRPAVDHLMQRSDVDDGRIAVAGLSMGGEQAITAAATDPRIRAVVAEGVGVRTYADLSAYPMDLAGWVTRGEGLLMFPLADLLSGARPPAGLRDAVRAAAPRPLLLIAGAGEETVNRYYRDAAPSTVDLWELPGTPHTQGLATHPEQWRARVVGFLDRALHAPA